MLNRIRRPSPSMVVAMIALFFALGGVAGAVSAVPLAKRALKADNARKLSGKTLAQVTAQAASLPGPAVVTTVAGSAEIPAGVAGYATITCDGGKKAIAGGYRYDTDAFVLALDSHPYSYDTWRIFLINDSDTSVPVTLYASCVLAGDSDGGPLSAPASGTDGQGATTFRQVSRAPGSFDRFAPGRRAGS